MAETEEFLAFLDIRPNTRGHTLCIPKMEIDKIFDFEEETFMGLMAFTRKVAKGIEQVIPCKRVGMAVVGLEVPHVHVHLIPLHSMRDMDFSQVQSLNEKEFQDLADKIANAVADNS